MTYAVGVLVALVVELIKNYAGTSKLGTLLSLFVVSLVVGAATVLIENSPYSEIVIQIIGSAAAFHNLILRQIESATGFPEDKNPA